MALIKYSGIGIDSLCASVPETIVKTVDQTKYFTQEQLAGFIKTTGVLERRFASSNMCSSDLCFDAAINLLDESTISRDKIGALIFISQTPDYRIPGSSIVLQDRLQLSKSTLAFDVNMTCSGYIYGLFLAYSLANSGIDNVLLLIGETMSRVASPQDRSTGLLLGDAGSATLITKHQKYGDSFFSLNTDGSFYESVIVPSGGYRNMSSPKTLTKKTDDDGNVRNEEQLKMDGMDVFSFAVSEIPKDVLNILKFAGLEREEIDKYIFHQANRYMMDHIAKKAKLNSSKMLYSIHKYGNTSGVSIPLTISDQNMLLQNGDTVLLNGIGAGFSWGSSILQLADTNILNVSELKS